MALKKDKEKVLGEIFDDERIKTFLVHDSYGETNPDYHLLERAYRGMRADNFSTFLGFFKAAGHDINAKNQQGKTFLQTISQHQQANDYIKAIKSNGGV